jgi:hypothetical protein
MTYAGPVCRVLGRAYKAVRRRRSLQAVVWLSALVFYCEFLHYYVVMVWCVWPELTTPPEPTWTDPGDDHAPDIEPVRAMFLADTHLLGFREGHWFDRLRRYEIIVYNYLHLPMKCPFFLEHTRFRMCAHPRACVHACTHPHTPARHTHTHTHTHSRCVPV